MKRSQTLPTLIWQPTALDIEGDRTKLECLLADLLVCVRHWQDDGGETWHLQLLQQRGLTTPQRCAGASCKASVRFVELHTCCCGPLAITSTSATTHLALGLEGLTKLTIGGFLQLWTWLHQLAGRRTYGSHTRDGSPLQAAAAGRQAAPGRLAAWRRGCSVCGTRLGAVATRRARWTPLDRACAHSVGITQPSGRPAWPSRSSLVLGILRCAPMPRRGRWRTGCRVPLRRQPPVRRWLRRRLPRHNSDGWLLRCSLCEWQLGPTVCKGCSSPLLPASLCRNTAETDNTASTAEGPAGGEATSSFPDCPFLGHK